MRAKFNATHDQRDMVELLVALNHGQEYIAGCLKIDEKTLRLNFAKELKDGARDYGAKLVAALSRRALRGDVTAAREIMRRINNEPFQKPARAEAKRSLKVSADELAKTAHIGTSWEAILGDGPFINSAPKSKRRRAA